ncbi:GNAT family N-acetyltransferase [Pseudomonas sp. CDFA 602]|uniref:GNAT family N-acetyltransferase n=1 Tax=Pseudomonas californiensis TaxID=2829823 RepID=UPI001E6012ED|nr:GNAT family N-acetyltransferase [Pseudomonas californiensis]MCD5994592.1 GNAT family N-acetyltransferase [Pseudomonas californiensis]MCD6000046.1 GNAT family N-acetyltransferase [Pseudomonas californiensis]
MISLDWLANHMEHSDTLALWLHQQFSHEFAQQSLADWQHEFSQGQYNGHWQCLIALEQGTLLGCAALASEDLSDRPDLYPWLACVFVTPQARGRGLAAQLIEGICMRARSTGVSTLYLHTQDQQAYYAKRGWTERERLHAWGRELSLMSRVL